MSLAAQQHSFSNTLTTTAPNIESKTTPEDTEANLTTLLGAYTNGQKHMSMERSGAGYTQSGLPTPYPHAFTSPQSEESSADHSSAAQYQSNQEVRSNNYPQTATPTSDYSGYHPSSTRSATFPDHTRQYQPSSHSSSSGGMAQPPSPSIPLQDGRSDHQTPQIKSDQDVPIDPSIAASSPTYPPHGGHPSTYPQQDQMQQYSYNQSHTGGNMYQQPRPNWANYDHAGHATHAGHPGHPGHPGHHPAPHNGMSYPVSAASAQASAAPKPHGQVYSFVPIPGAQQHKRPRRRYEEIERMYKCGYQGCQKAYGTLNHLNAHVTMQSHGVKRTPEEFKEIRKEWKARKKEEEQQRKEADSSRTTTVPDTQTEAPTAPYAPARSSHILPPIGNSINYQPGAQVPNQYQQSQPPAPAVQQLQQYSNGQSNIDHYGGYPASPYGSSGHMYSSQSASAQPKFEH